MKTETFFKYLKQEELSRRHFKNLIEVKQAVFQYIEGFYNPRRPHSANNLLAPQIKKKLNTFRKPTNFIKTVHFIDNDPFISPENSNMIVFCCFLGDE